MKKKKAFSMMELTISFIIVALITGISAPILVKKMKAGKLGVKNIISNSCAEINNTTPGAGSQKGTCRLCYGKPGEKICLSCDLNCPTNSYLDKQNCTCTPCHIKYPNQVAQCDRCDVSYCKRCARNQGYYLDRTASVSPPQYCRLCEINNYCPDGINKYTCPINSTTKNLTGRFRANQCICNGGYWRKVAATNTNKGTCLNCGKGYYCPDSSQPDSDVGEGVNKRRKPCGAGYYCQGDNETSRTDCGEGYYCPGPTDFKPTPCPGNENGIITSFTNTVNATSITQCKCSNNSYKYGYNASTGGFVKCAICPDGYWCNGTSATACGAGVYCPGTGNTQATIKTCPAGYKCPAPGPNGSGIQPCACGTYSGAGAAGCSSSAPGYYTPANVYGLYTSVAPCVAGNACDGCSLNDCGCGTYSGNGYSQCAIAPAGYISNEENTGILYCSGKKEYTSVQGKCKCNSCKDGKIANSAHTGCVEPPLECCKTVKKNDATKCKECKSGCVLKDNGKCCKKITQAQKDKCAANNATYVQTDKYGCEGICVKRSNSSCNKKGVTQLEAGGKACGNKSACCWSGKTSAGIKDYNTTQPKVCNYYAAVKCCTGKWRLPDKSELNYIAKKTTCWWKWRPGEAPDGTGCNSIKLCMNSSNHADDGTPAEPVYACANFPGCKGGQFVTGVNTQNDVCAAHVIWGEDSFLIDNTEAVSTSSSPQPRAPYSVRCVADVEDL